jgi:hypothetical protein
LLRARVAGEPLRLAALRDRVVLLDFRTFACVNCRRTVPFLRRMHDQYQPTSRSSASTVPGFAFERSVQNVERAVPEHGLESPVGLNNDYVAWNVYGNRYSPTMYLIDRAGHMRYTLSAANDARNTDAPQQRLHDRAIGRRIRRWMRPRIDRAIVDGS